MDSKDYYIQYHGHGPEQATMAEKQQEFFRLYVLGKKKDKKQPRMYEGKLLPGFCGWAFEKTYGHPPPDEWLLHPEKCKPAGWSS